MINKHSDEDYIKVLEGIWRKTTVFGEKTLLSKFRLTGGVTLPDHAHPFEQTGYLLEGNLNLKIGDEYFNMEPGDSWSIPADTIHGADVLKNSVAIEVFAPAREDYMPK